MGLVVFVLVAVLIIQGIGRASSVSDREELELARRAIRQAAVSCYAMEGAYPASYEELKARTGLAIDEEKYAVFYEVFASNIMPEISVMKMMAPEAIMPRGSDWNRPIRSVGNCVPRYLKLAASTTVRLPSAVSIEMRVY